MARRMIRQVLTAALTCELAAVVVFAQSSIGVTGAGGGVYPPNTVYGGLPLNGVQFGFGVNIRATGTVGGRVDLTLIGLTAPGQPQNIEVEGKATAASATVGSTSTVSGTAMVNMGDGTPGGGTLYTNGLKSAGCRARLIVVGMFPQLRRL